MDISNNLKTPKEMKNTDETDILDMDNMKDILKDQNTTITNSSQWATINEKDLLNMFQLGDQVRPVYTEAELKQKVIDIFNQTEDPLSVEALKKKFPNFPSEWSDYVSKSALDKINVIMEEEKVKKIEGDFNISFK